MTYSDFTLEDLELKLGVSNKIKRLFNDKIEAVSPSERLKEDLQIAADLPIKSEKARSELIVVPILLELRKRNENYFTIYSGDKLVADKQKGLTGECDFILAKSTDSFSINVPIISIVEAKKNDIEIGVPQCGAQLIGAKIFNKQRGKEIKSLYGCVTTGELWKFLLLDDNILYIDKNTYYLGDVEELLGAFQIIIEKTKH